MKAGVVPAADGPDDALRIGGRAFLLSLAAVLLNFGLVLAIVPEHPLTATVYTLALGAALAAVFLPGIGPLKRVAPRHTAGLLAAGLIAQLALLFRLPPGYVLDPPFTMAGLPFGVGLAVTAGLLVLLIRRPVRGPLEPAFLGMMVTFGAMGAWMIAISPDPPMDVHIFQEQGAATFLRGENPYSIRTYPDIYGEDSGLYAPELVEDGHLTFGFTYPPLSLLFAVPGHLIGDYRYVQLASMLATSLLIAAIHPGRLAVLVALLLLFNPRAFFVLEAGWTDPYALALLATTVLLAVRRSPLLPIALGLLVAIKQHMVIMLPLAACAMAGGMSTRSRLRVVGLASLIALAVTVPMLLWNVRDFVYSTITVHLLQPFRSDSMSYLAWFGAGGEPGLPTWTGFALLAPTAGLVLWKLGRSSAAFATTAAVTYFVFFLFSKQAFIHYYYFVIGTLCIATVTWVSAQRTDATVGASGVVDGLGDWKERASAPELSTGRPHQPRDGRIQGYG